MYRILLDYLNVLKKPDYDLIWGVIGPPSQSVEAAASILPFAANSGVITVSNDQGFTH